MRRRDGVPQGLWILGGLLALSWGVLALGTAGSQAVPGPHEPSPGGLSAFAELLVRSGYQVRVDPSRHPRLTPDELAVAAFTEPDDAPFLNEHLANGGNVLALPVPRGFDMASREVMDTTTLLHDGGVEPLEVTWVVDRSELLPNGLTEGEQDAWVLWYETDESDFATLYQVDKGVLGTLVDGMIATNRFLPKHGNAALLLGVVRALAPEGGTVVFVPETYGAGVEPGLLATIGPWAAAAGTQAAWLFVVVVWTLGRRFGLPDSDHTPQRGAAELVDGISQIYDRSSATPIALEAAWRHADLRIRRELKLPRGTPREVRDRQIASPLAHALAEVEAAGVLHPKPYEALRLARNLDRQMAFQFGSKTRPSPQ